MGNWWALNTLLVNHRTSSDRQRNSTLSDLLSVLFSSDENWFCSIWRVLVITSVCRETPQTKKLEEKYWKMSNFTKFETGFRALWLFLIYFVTYARDTAFWCRRRFRCPRNWSRRSSCTSPPSTCRPAPWPCTCLKIGWLLLCTFCWHHKSSVTFQQNHHV